MTTLTIRPGPQNREAVLKVLNETFDGVLDVADAQKPPTPLDDSMALAQRADDRGDVFQLDRQLDTIAITAVIARAQLRADHPELA